MSYVKLFSVTESFDDELESPTSFYAALAYAESFEHVRDLLVEYLMGLFEDDFGSISYRQTEENRAKGLAYASLELYPYAEDKTYALFEIALESDKVAHDPFIKVLA
jgi:hypothetical protein